MIHIFFYTHTNTGKCAGRETHRQTEICTDIRTDVHDMSTDTYLAYICLRIQIYGRLDKLINVKHNRINPLSKLTSSHRIV